MMSLVVEQVYRENPGRQSAGLAICEADKRKGTFQPLDRQLVDPLLDFPVRMFPCLAQFVEVLVQDVLVGEFPKRLIPKAGQPDPVAPEDMIEGGMDGFEGGAQIFSSPLIGNFRGDGKNLDVHPVVIVSHDFVVSQVLHASSVAIDRSISVLTKAPRFGRGQTCVSAPRSMPTPSGLSGFFRRPLAHYEPRHLPSKVESLKRRDQARASTQYSTRRRCVSPGARVRQSSITLAVSIQSMRSQASSANSESRRDFSTQGFQTTAEVEFVARIWIRRCQAGSRIARAAGTC